MKNPIKEGIAEGVEWTRNIPVYGQLNEAFWRATGLYNPDERSAALVIEI